MFSQNKLKNNIHVDHAIKKGYLPLLVDTKGIILEKQRKLYRASNDLTRLNEWTSYPGTALHCSPLLRRTLRLQPSNMVQLNDSDYILVANKSILYKTKQSHFTEVFTIPRGSRPLQVCATRDGRIYWGEYFQNKRRDEVNIYESTTGSTWKVVWTFPRGTIRHVHGVFEDKFRKGLWVLTGDSDKESGLWFTGDHFKTLTLIVGNTQKARAVSIIPTPESLIVPMDSPLETNYIQELDLHSKQFRNLRKLPGSAFHCYHSDELSVISTVIEPSKVNTEKRLSVMASIDNLNWHVVADLRGDVLSSLSYKYFRYPEITFAREQGYSEYLWLYARAVDQLDNCCIRIRKTDIIDFISGR